MAERVRFDTADARNLPFSDASFDVVLSNLVYHNIPARRDRQLAYGEALRVLEPGGNFVYSDGLWSEGQRDDLLAAGFQIEMETPMPGSDALHVFVLTRPGGREASVRMV